MFSFFFRFTSLARYIDMSLYLVGKKKLVKHSKEQIQQTLAPEKWRCSWVTDNAAESSTSTPLNMQDLSQCASEGDQENLKCQ